MRKITKIYESGYAASTTTATTTATTGEANANGMETSDGTPPYGQVPAPRARLPSRTIVIEPMDEDLVDASDPRFAKLQKERRPGRSFATTSMATTPLELSFTPTAENSSAAPGGTAAAAGERDGAGESDAPTEFLCNYCVYTTEDAGKFDAHAYSHMFKCDWCDFVTTTRASVMRHMASGHGEEAARTLSRYRMAREGQVEPASRADEFFESIRRQEASKAESLTIQTRPQLRTPLPLLK